MEEKPQFQHDCEKCIFLGRYGENYYNTRSMQNEWIEYDLYHCGGETNWPTVIARYGNEGPQYSSGLSAILGDEEFAKVHLGYLFEAKKRAEKRGLNCEYGKFDISKKLTKTED